MTLPRPAHQRILLKLSGEALMGNDAFGINRETIVRMAAEVAEVINPVSYTHLTLPTIYSV